MDEDDEELAAEKDDRAVLLGFLRLTWRDVLKVDGRGVLLDIAAGVDELQKRPALSLADRAPGR